MPRRSLARCALAALSLLVWPAAAQEELAREVQARLHEGQAALREASRARSAGDEEAARPALERALTAYARVLEAAPRLEGVPAAALAEAVRVAHYNTACALALLGRRAEAIDALGRALEAGYDDFARLERDPDLDVLRTEARFVQFLERERERLLRRAGAEEKPQLSPRPLFPYDFDVVTLDGRRLRLADLRGKLVVVDYWGTWCPPCRQEIPHFQRLAEEFGDRLVVVGLAWERGLAPEVAAERVRRFRRELKIRYPLAVLRRVEDLARVPELKAFPTTLFIDRQGRVRARETGYRDFETLHRLLHALDEASPVDGGDEPAEGGAAGEGAAPASPGKEPPPAPRPQRRSF